MNVFTDLVPAKYRKKVHAALLLIATLLTAAVAVYTLVSQHWGDWPAILGGLASMAYTASNYANTSTPDGSEG